MITQNLEDFTAKRPFEVVGFAHSSALNAYQKKKRPKAFESALSLFQLESRLRKTMQYIEAMNFNDEQ